MGPEDVETEIDNTDEYSNNLETKLRHIHNFLKLN